jgi:hypothetical protein
MKRPYKRNRKPRAPVAMSPEARAKISAANRRRWQASRDGTGPKPGRKRAMSRNAAARLRYAKRAGKILRTEKRSAQEIEARAAGASIMNEKELRRPTFIVVTPQGRRIETLEPDLV